MLVLSGYVGIHFFVEVLTIASKEKEAFVNEKIRAREVMVIGPNGEQLGIKSRQDALTLANYAGFDLVMVGENANPPVCKIMDYNKFRYEKKKQMKDAQKKQRDTNLELKECRLSVTIDKHDLETKTKNVVKYLQKGHKIKVTVRFKGRQVAHPELGKDVLLKFVNDVIAYGEIEIPPKLEGKSMSLQLMPKK